MTTTPAGIFLGLFALGLPVVLALLVARSRPPLALGLLLSIPLVAVTWYALLMVVMEYFASVYQF